MYRILLSSEGTCNFFQFGGAKGFLLLFFGSYITMKIYELCIKIYLIFSMLFSQLICFEYLIAYKFKRKKYKGFNFPSQLRPLTPWDRPYFDDLHRHLPVPWYESSRIVCHQKLADNVTHNGQFEKQFMKIARRSIMVHLATRSLRHRRYGPLFLNLFSAFFPHSIFLFIFVYYILKHWISKIQYIQ